MPRPPPRRIARCVAVAPTHPETPDDEPPHIYRVADVVFQPGTVESTSAHLPNRCASAE
jgi:hypothetical protein